MVASGGWDAPESQYEALFQLATGKGFDLDGDGIFDAPVDARPFIASPADRFSGTVAGTYNAGLAGSGDLGGVGFRPGALHLVVLGSDDVFRDPDTGWLLGNVGTPPAGRSAAIAALNAIDAHVISIASGSEPVPQMTDLANATGAVVDRDGDGIVEPLVYSIREDGAGLSSAVSDGILEMLTGSGLDITILADDKWGFILSIDPPVVDRLYPGEAASFTLSLRGAITAGNSDRVYRIPVELVDADGTVLDSKLVVIVVPREGT